MAVETLTVLLLWFVGLTNQLVMNQWWVTQIIICATFSTPFKHLYLIPKCDIGLLRGNFRTGNLT